MIEVVVARRILLIRQFDTHLPRGKIKIAACIGQHQSQIRPPGSSGVHHTSTTHLKSAHRIFWIDGSNGIVTVEVSITHETQYPAQQSDSARRLIRLPQLHIVFAGGVEDLHSQNLILVGF